MSLETVKEPSWYTQPYEKEKVGYYSCEIFWHCKTRGKFIHLEDCLETKDQQEAMEWLAEGVERPEEFDEGLYEKRVYFVEPMGEEDEERDLEKSRKFKIKMMEVRL